MHDNPGYPDLRERVRHITKAAVNPVRLRSYKISVISSPCSPMARLTWRCKISPPIKQAAVWEILHHIQVHHFEEVRLVRLVRDRMVEEARRQGKTAEEANVVAQVALYHEFLQMPYPAPHNGRWHS